ncbi:MAG: hypothetical protein JNL05_07495 [Flavobacteriales bacterium]|nr:hypothetical protein [Flavobacteriales bacterium]
MYLKPMMMKTCSLFRSTGLAASLVIGVLFLCSAIPPLAVGPGFATAYLSSATLSELANGTGAAGVRVYNARRSATDAAGTVVVIGVQSLKGAELSGSATDKRYALYDKLGSSFVVEARLERSLARSAVLFIVPTRDLRFCVDLAKADVGRLLSANGCNAVKVEPVPQGSGFTMRFTPVKVVNGVPEPISGAVVITATEPCPTACGPLTNYLW